MKNRIDYISIGNWAAFKYDVRQVTSLGRRAFAWTSYVKTWESVNGDMSHELTPAAARRAAIASIANRLNALHGKPYTAADVSNLIKAAR